MSIEVSNKEQFTALREDFFQKNFVKKNALKASMEFSLLIEEQIHKLANGKKYNFALVSAGSFSRRELSPFSDIDLMFITYSVQEVKNEISELVQRFWDNGIDVSHTVREFSDIQKFLTTDLHTFTQFFETRLLLGSEKIYSDWNENLFSSLTEKNQKRIIVELIKDIEDRYQKYGDSAKTLEPNVKLSPGGLRDFQAVEWMYIILNKTLLNKQAEITQAESFLDLIKNLDLVSQTFPKLKQNFYLIVIIKFFMLEIQSIFSRFRRMIGLNSTRRKKLPT